VRGRTEFRPASAYAQNLHQARWRTDSARSGKKESFMLHYALVFLVIAIIAGVLGFGGIAGASVGIAKILFLVFVILFVLSLLMGRRRGF
jgi:uncharacterized membrane protein YtjA (UPF0391 family)